MIVTKTRTLGPQGNALQAEQQVGGSPVGATILIASDRHLDPEPERPIRLQVVAGPRFEPTTCRCLSRTAAPLWLSSLLLRGRAAGVTQPGRRP